MVTERGGTREEAVAYSRDVGMAGGVRGMRSEVECEVVHWGMVVVEILLSGGCIAICPVVRLIDHPIIHHSIAAPQRMHELHIVGI